jgi:hypothetical protein
MLPEIGHVNASFKLSKQLKGRGHQVYHLAIPDFEQYIESQSLEVLPLKRIWVCLQWSLQISKSRNA